MCKALQSVIVPSKENQISKEVASYVLPPLRWLTYWRMHCNYHFLFLLPCMPLSFRPLDSRPKQEQGEWAYSVTSSSTRALSSWRRWHSNKKWDCDAGCRIEAILQSRLLAQFKCQTDVGGRYRLNFGCMRFKTLPPFHSTLALVLLSAATSPSTTAARSEIMEGGKRSPPAEYRVQTQTDRRTHA